MCHETTITVDEGAGELSRTNKHYCNILDVELGKMTNFFSALRERMLHIFEKIFEVPTGRSFMEN